MQNKNAEIPLKASKSKGPAAKKDPIQELFNKKELRHALPGLIVSAFLANLLALPLPLAILQILDRVVVNQTLSTLTFLAMGLFTAIVLEQVLRFLNGVITSWLTARYEHQTTLDVVAHLFRVPLRYYQREEPISYAEKLRSANSVARFHSGEAILGLLDLPFVLLFILLIWLIGGQLVIVPLVILLIFTVVLVHYGSTRQEDARDRADQDEKRYSFLNEVFSGIHSVKTMMMGKLMVRRYERLQRATAEAGEHVAYINDSLDRVGHYFSQIIVVSIVFFGSWFVIEGEITPGALGACLILSIRLMRPLRRALNVKVQISEYERAKERLQSLLSMPSEDNTEKPSLPFIEKGIQLCNIQVKYSERVVLQGINLAITKNSCIAIQSPSGSGKTTLLNVLCGLEQPDEGQVFVDEKPLSNYSSRSIHNRIGLLSQNGVLVSGTILDNLTMFDKALDERALSISKDLGLDKFVARMKFGYETRLGENANEILSAGTRQLISIVRALVFEPEVILFDEANVSLDSDTDRTVRTYLEGRKSDLTIILVTHRPSYLALAEKIYHLENGLLKEGPAVKTTDRQDSSGELIRPNASNESEHIIIDHFSEPNDLSRCLLPLLNALGWHGRQRELLEALPHFEPRLDLSSFLSVLVDLGYRPAKIGKLKRVPDSRLYPCLFLPKLGAGIIILERTTEGQVRVFKGEDSRIDLFDSLGLGVGDYYTFSKAKPKEVGDSQEGWFARLVDRFKHHRQVILFITIITTVLSIAPPLFVRATWDFVIPVRDISVGFYLMFGVAIAIFLGWLLSLGKSRLMGYISGRLDYIFGINLVQRILELPASAVDSVPVNRQIRRIRGLTRVREYFVGPVARLVFDLPAMLVLLVAVILVNPSMVMVFIVSAFSFYSLAILVQKKSRSVVGKVSIGFGNRTEFLDEMLHAARVIRQTGSESKWFDRLRGLSASTALSGFFETRFNLAVRAASQVIASSTGLAALIFSAYLAIKGEITNGTLIATQILVWRITGPLQNAFLSITSGARIKENIRQINNLMRLQTEEDQGVRQTVRPESPGGLELSRISFRYSNTVDPSLLGVDIKVRPKEFVAVTGHSGAGKSTLLKMILRIYTPQAGSIRLDDVDIRQLTATDLRVRVSYLPQVCDIFYGTVAQNIKLAYPTATDAEVQWSSQMAGLLDETLSLPQGLDTRISSSRMIELPSGFRHRLSLARTMLKPAPLVLMDEPETGMDEKGEAALLRCIEWLRGRATLIVVTLRPSHLRLADRVVHLRNARVAAVGTYEQVQKVVNAGTRP